MVFLLTTVGSVFDAVFGGLSRAGARTLFVVPNTQALLRPSTRLSSIDRDADVIAKHLTDVEVAAPLVTFSTIVTACEKKRVVRVVGVLPLSQVLESLNLASGRFVTDLDNQRDNPVAIIGHGLSEDFRCLGVDSPLVVAGRVLRVVGTLQPKGQMMLGDFDNSVFMPIRYAASFESEGTLLHRVTLVVAKPAASVDRMKLRIESVLREARGTPPRVTPDFQIITNLDVSTTMERTRSLGTIAVTCVSGVGLIAALIGFANSILASVMHRRAEIGLMRCVGATRRDIRRFFMCEALLIVAGGVGVGVLGGMASAALLLPLGGVVPVWNSVNVLIPSISAMLFGVVAAAGPADYAARLDPVVALNHE